MSTAIANPTTDYNPTTDHPTTITSRQGVEVEYLVRLTSGETVVVDGANAYQPEGPMTTFFSTGSTRATIDSWSIRVASFRTADVVSVRRSVTTVDSVAQRSDSVTQRSDSAASGVPVVLVAV